MIIYSYGSKTDIQIEIGNSVPPILAQEIGKTIKKMLNGEKSNQIFETK